MDDSGLDSSGLDISGLDTAMLHALTEDLASFLSEVTVGDLGLPLPGLPSTSRTWPDGATDLGDLCLAVLEQNLGVASALTGVHVPPGQWPRPADRGSLADLADPFGGGLETAYRAAAALMVNAFASAGGTRPAEFGRAGPRDLPTLYATQARETAAHTRALAEALGCPIGAGTLAWLADTDGGTDGHRPVGRQRCAGSPRADRRADQGPAAHGPDV